MSSNPNELNGMALDHCTEDYNDRGINIIQTLRAKKHDMRLFYGECLGHVMYFMSAIAIHWNWNVYIIVTGCIESGQTSFRTASDKNFVKMTKFLS